MILCIMVGNIVKYQYTLERTLIYTFINILSMYLISMQTEIFLYTFKLNTFAKNIEIFFLKTDIFHLPIFVLVLLEYIYLYLSPYDFFQLPPKK